MVWTREHNTKGGGRGRLHLNVLWDEEWVDQGWLSKTAKACGFGEVMHIERVGAGGRHALQSGRGDAQGVERYVTKCLRYATKDLSSQTDWPTGTRRRGASRAAREQMKRPDNNPDWYWSPVEPPKLPLSEPQRLIPVGDGAPYERAPGCACRTTFCRCGARSDLETDCNPFARASPAPPAA